MSGPTILMIEDNSLIVELARDLLAEDGFEVQAASSAEEGIQLARQMAPDLVLMDINLPGMDGLTATRALKADPATSRLRIIGLTAHATRGDEGAAMEAGFDGYLTKPIDTRDFTASIRRFLAKGG